MVTTAELGRRLELSLSAIEDEVDFLPELADRWANESDAGRGSWFQEWQDLVERLGALDQSYRAGTLPLELVDRYQTLLGQLPSAVAILTRLDLPQPAAPPSR
ncbi:MAG: hypothetical protein HY329_02520 [Chloroflexi bacterium]|nr:hypothetical protein [Chloroflexota bacterium]